MLPWHKIDNPPSCTWYKIEDPPIYLYQNRDPLGFPQTPRDLNNEHSLMRKFVKSKPKYTKI